MFQGVLARVFHGHRELQRVEFAGLRVELSVGVGGHCGAQHGHPRGGAVLPIQPTEIPTADVLAPILERRTKLLEVEHSLSLIHI